MGEATRPLKCRQCGGPCGVVCRRLGKRSVGPDVECTGCVRLEVEVRRLEREIERLTGAVEAQVENRRRRQREYVRRKRERV